MTLSPEVAAILRKALNDAEYFRCGDDIHAAYAELAEAVGNLLDPLPEGPDQDQLSDLLFLI